MAAGEASLSGVCATAGQADRIGERTAVRMKPTGGCAVAFGGRILSVGVSADRGLRRGGAHAWPTPSGRYSLKPRARSMPCKHRSPVGQVTQTL